MEFRCTFVERETCEQNVTGICVSNKYNKNTYIDHDKPTSISCVRNEHTIIIISTPVLG